MDYMTVLAFVLPAILWAWVAHVAVFGKDGDGRNLRPLLVGLMAGFVVSVFVTTLILSGSIGFLIVAALVIPGSSLAVTVTQAAILPTSVTMLVPTAVITPIIAVIVVVGSRDGIIAKVLALGLGMMTIAVGVLGRLGIDYLRTVLK